MAGGAPDRGGGGRRLTSISGLKRVQAEQAALQAAHACAHARFAFTRPPRAPPRHASRCGARWRRAPRSAAASATATLSSSQPPSGCSSRRRRHHAVSEGQRGGGGPSCSRSAPARSSRWNTAEAAAARAVDRRGARSGRRSRSPSSPPTPARSTSRPRAASSCCSVERAAGAPPSRGARKSRGALLWQILRYRLREKGTSAARWRRSRSRTCDKK